MSFAFLRPFIDKPVIIGAMPRCSAPKQCVTCGDLKPAESFYLKGYGKNLDRRHSRCKACMIAYVIGRRKSNVL